MDEEEEDEEEELVDSSGGPSSAYGDGSEEWVEMTISPGKSKVSLNIWCIAIFQR